MTGESRGARSPLRVAVAQPACSPGDLEANALAHADLVRTAGADLVVFPELSLSGYDLEVPAIEPAAGVLGAVIDACRDAGCTALVGAPVVEHGDRFIAVLAVTGAGARAAYRKMCLGGDEPAHFSAGTEPAVVEVGGWRVGLGICKDTRIEDHLERTLGASVDLYAAGLVHTPDELADLDRRAERIIDLGHVPVAFASAAGAVGPAYPATAGHSGIWSHEGSVLARCGDATGEIVVADLGE